MVALPKRWTRHVSYLVGLLIMAGLLLKLAHDNKFITLPGFVFPSNWRQTNGHEMYILDVSIERCLKTKERCEVKDHSKGHLGKLQNAWWGAEPEDLMLGSSWMFKKNLNVKYMFVSETLDPTIEVVVDLAVSNPSVDGKIKGNGKKLIPEKVLKDIHNLRVFEDGDRAQLEEANKGEKLDGTVDVDEIARLKEQQQNQAEDFRTSEEKEKAEKAEAEKAEAEQAKADVENAVNEDAAKETFQQSTTEENKGEKDNKANEAKRSVDKRERKTNHKSLEGHYLIPNAEQLERYKWRKSVNGIWLKYGPPGKNAIRWLRPLYGPDAAYPHERVSVVKEPLLNIGTKEGLEPRLALIREKYLEPSRPELRFNKDGKFKILQIADAHFSTGVGKCRDPVPEESGNGCEADPRTLSFINQVLDIEKPDLVVFTGDQVNGESAPDPVSALYKLVTPIVLRKIPHAVVLGNHDDKSSVTREDMLWTSSFLPYSLTSPGPDDVDGYGNYALMVKSSGLLKRGAASLFFLDSHGYSTQPKVASGYDWFKESQIRWLESEAKGMEEKMVKEKRLSMAFFHIPIPEYRNVDKSPFVGQHKEGITAPRYNSDMRTVFSRTGIQVATVGHDHANDFCLLDTQNPGDKNFESKMWLCYGGAVGEGGYGGYGGYIRRLRVFELDENEGSIKSWKRAENDAGLTFDFQKIVDNGIAINEG